MPAPRLTGIAVRRRRLLCAVLAGGFVAVLAIGNLVWWATRYLGGAKQGRAPGVGGRQPRRRRAAASTAPWPLADPPVAELSKAAAWTGELAPLPAGGGRYSRAALAALVSPEVDVLGIGASGARIVPRAGAAAPEIAQPLPRFAPGNLSI
eukprot:TRINITY_DN36652_c0_g1_i1.p2 TRINITY_DN36652_c0_g1~~TRINITY_DN36652_c0_g1_i1.p2  ORF type:complete len:151 (+),score=12.47 TRINITY_DN36652_c0_g1_i1:111-563(+)